MADSAIPDNVTGLMSYVTGYKLAPASSPPSVRASSAPAWITMKEKHDKFKVVGSGVSPDDDNQIVFYRWQPSTSGFPNIEWVKVDINRAGGKTDNMTPITKGWQDAVTNLPAMIASNTGTVLDQQSVYDAGELFDLMATWAASAVDGMRTQVKDVNTKDSGFKGSAMQAWSQKVNSAINKFADLQEQAKTWSQPMKTAADSANRFASHFTDELNSFLGDPLSDPNRFLVGLFNSASLVQQVANPDSDYTDTGYNNTNRNADGGLGDGRDATTAGHDTDSYWVNLMLSFPGQFPGVWNVFEPGSWPIIDQNIRTLWADRVEKYFADSIQLASKMADDMNAAADVLHIAETPPDVPGATPTNGPPGGNNNPPTTINIPPPGATKLPPPGSTNVPPPGSTNVPPPGSTNIPPGSKLELPNHGNEPPGAGSDGLGGNGPTASGLHLQNRNASLRDPLGGPGGAGSTFGAPGGLGADGKSLNGPGGPLRRSSLLGSAGDGGNGPGGVGAGLGGLGLGGSASNRKPGSKSSVGSLNGPGGSGATLGSLSPSQLAQLQKTGALDKVPLTDAERRTLAAAGMPAGSGMSHLGDLKPGQLSELQNAGLLDKVPLTAAQQKALADAGMPVTAGELGGLARFTGPGGADSVLGGLGKGAGISLPHLEHGGSVRMPPVAGLSGHGAGVNMGAGSGSGLGQKAYVGSPGAAANFGGAHGPGGGTGLNGHSGGNGHTGDNAVSGVGGGTGSTSGGGGMPFMPGMGGMGGMGNGGSGNNKKDRERTTWLTEDEELWGTDPDCAPAVIGRRGTTTAEEFDESQWDDRPSGGRGRDRDRDDTRDGRVYRR